MILLLSALAPIATIIIYIYVKDLYEKESKRMLALAFLLGGIVSIVITTLLYVIFDLILPLPDKSSVWQQFIKAFFMVALIEEFSKYVMVWGVLQPRTWFNEPFDGIVYAVMVSMGFAAVENVMYVLQGGVDVALIRAFSAVPAHATFGIIMGYFMGKAKFSNDRVIWNIVGLLSAIVLHGAYDFFLFINFIPGISVGAIISLIIGIILSKKAIKLHQNISHFKR
ncbi:PrsW family glutamic-type intramembrane protease [Flavobacteriaceae bacterium]|jgi:protease PrsW|nr:PrsW family glutamic-type intramembrane protease [Flavobacteriaceae bacterium]